MWGGEEKTEGEKRVIPNPPALQPRTNKRKDDKGRQAERCKVFELGKGRQEEGKKGQSHWKFHPIKNACCNLVARGSRNYSPAC